MTPPENNSERKDNLLLVLGFGLMGLALLLMIFPVIPLLKGKWDDDLASKIGDFESGVGSSLLSLAGILLLIQTIKDQRRGLQQQVDEFKEMRRNHQEQQFEVMFFQALNGHNELVKYLEIKTPLGATAGKSCLRYLYDEFKRECKGKNDLAAIFAAYRDFSEKHALVLKQYTQSVEKLYSFVYGYRVQVDDAFRKNLLGFISAQLTYHEEFFLLLHLTATPALASLSEMIARYDIFECPVEAPFEALHQTLLFKTPPGAP